MSQRGPGALSDLANFDFGIIEIKMIHLNFPNIIISWETLNCNFGKLFVKYWNQ